MPYMFFGIKTDGSASVLFGTPHFAFGYDSPLVQRNVVLNQQTGGTIAAAPMSGYDGDIITLSNTADAGYTFNTYNLTGATLTGNQFMFSGSDVTAEPDYTHNVYNVSITQVAGGTVAASPSTGYYGTQVTLSNTPSSEYTFGSYSITGATLTGNKFNFEESNVTAKGSFTQKTITFKAIANSNAVMYVTATKNGSTTSWNTTTATTTVERTIPINSTISYRAEANSYYRCKSCVQTAVNNFTSARQSDAKIITGTGVATANGGVSTNATTQNKISWQYSFTMPSNSWGNNKGGVYEVEIAPTGGVTNFSSMAGLTMAQCIPGGTVYSSTAAMRGCTARVTATSTQSYTCTYINTNGTASRNVWFSAHINLTGKSNHGTGYWTGTASNGGQRGLKAWYMTTAGLGSDPAKNIYNDFYNMTTGRTRTTAFNLTGANNQVATNYGWGPQYIRLQATLGVPSNGATYGTACPPNTITNVVATVKCSSWVP